MAYFIPNCIIKTVAETLNADKDRLKFDWDDFRIRLKQYYKISDHAYQSDNFIVSKIFITKNCTVDDMHKTVYIDKILFHNNCDIKNKMHKILRNCKNIKFIGISEIFNMNSVISEDFYVEGVSIFSIIKGLSLYDCINITLLQNLKNLTHLSFGNDFNQDITVLKDLTCLTYLRFGKRFNQDITPLKDLKNLTHLSFNGWNFNQDITALKDLIDLTYLSFGDGFNQDIIVLKYLRRLRYLKFGNAFNKSIAPLKGLKNLSHLIFGDMFNQQIDVLKSCTKLRHLVFGKYFNKPLDALINIKIIDKLIFGNNFNNSIEPLKNIKRIKYLKFGRYFKQNDTNFNDYDISQLVFSTVSCFKITVPIHFDAFEVNCDNIIFTKYKN